MNIFNTTEWAGMMSNKDNTARYIYDLIETRKNISEIHHAADTEVSRLQARIDAVNAWRDSTVEPLQSKIALCEKLLLILTAEGLKNPSEKGTEELHFANSADETVDFLNFIRNRGKFEVE